MSILGMEIRIINNNLFNQLFLNNCKGNSIGKGETE